jgi:hypothetical protein
MAKQPHKSPNWPSKKPGKPSGPGRDVNPPRQPTPKPSSPPRK